MANLTNNFGAYMQIPTFRFWCQHVIPLVYDDSLSYYEVLCKAVQYINNIIGDLKTTQDNLSELAENSEGKFEELETLINSSLTGEYGGLRRKILALTDSARDAMTDERKVHLRVNNISRSNDGEITTIQFRMMDRSVTVRLTASIPGSFGMINGLRGFNISVTAMYGNYSENTDVYTSWTLYKDGNPVSLDDLYVGQLINTFTIYKRQNENCYIVTHITSTGVHIFYKYDSANIPGGNTKWARNPYVRAIEDGSDSWVDVIHDEAMQVVTTRNNHLVIVSQDATFAADTWHKLNLMW